MILPPPANTYLAYALWYVVVGEDVKVLNELNADVTPTDTVSSAEDHNVKIFGCTGRLFEVYLK